MSKVLFLNILGHGHINPTIGIVKELINRGDEVTYLAGEEFRDKIEKTGAKFKGHKNLLNANFLGGNSNFENNQGLLDGMSTLKEIIEIIFNSKEKFDYIIYDSSFMLGQEIGRVLKIPTICSNTTFAVNEKILELQADKFKSQLEEIKPKIATILSSSFFMGFIKELKEKYDINFPVMLEQFAGKGMMNIVYTSKFFQPYGESFDESYKFIGPSIADREENIHIDLDNEDKKIIYISLGTVFNDLIEFYEDCFKAFKDVDAKVVMSVGKKININMFKEIPSNFIVRNYVSQLEVLKHTDVFITHGGMNSASEGLYYDVPLILIPQSVDQPYIANRVVELGAGIALDNNKITPEILKESVVKVLSDDNFKINSRKVGKSLREAGGYKKGVAEIIDFTSSISQLV
ncbi:glycosyltransferase, MGT family [Clostridium sp. DL-VIII]|uniref:macrolide family glycosyltransferase n=1 Tax=Clostridium sp. DL-VIII TaxID=641107 RepID=UPI00023AFA2C|nr:macrolide family glycosyltransferase [Clostridium sp. DL-VIII]EHJ00636.1 glycosyltransferase, MGT family [Clostridium sp. DL-VIII]